MRKIAVAMAVVLMVSGCATTSTVRNARGSGNAQVYSASYDKTYDAALNAMRDCALEILEKDKSTGTIIGKKGMGYVSYGERVAIYLNKVDESHTRVEVISKKVLATNIFAKDWTGTLFQKINQSLAETSNA